MTGTKTKKAEKIVEATKPLLRGVLHQIFFFVFLIIGFALVNHAPVGKARLACLIYAISMPALLGTSALYHRVNWKKPSARLWMKRLDHSMIFVLIAGTYTPMCMLGLPEPAASFNVRLIWGAAIAAAIVRLVWLSAPKWFTACTYVVVGWIGIMSVPHLVQTVGKEGVGILVLAGVIYSIGAVTYARQKPNPFPNVFGYHEVFHALVVLAMMLMLCVVVFYVLPYHASLPIVSSKVL